MVEESLEIFLNDNTIIDLGVLLIEFGVLDCVMEIGQKIGFQCFFQFLFSMQIEFYGGLNLCDFRMGFRYT